MPLIVITGYPSSGKSTLANKLAEHIKEQHGKTAVIVREQDYLRGPKNEILDDSRKEKDLRAKVKSEAQRLLNKETVVIVDALNYIKGYRYELFCMSKAVPTRQVTVHPDIPSELAWQWNENRDAGSQYTKIVFDHLVERYETPDPQNRWDSPYFSVLPDEDLDLEAVCVSLFTNKPPKQNMSTQNKPVSETNFLASVEKVTSEILQAVATTRAADPDTDEVQVPHSSNVVILNDSVTTTQLTKLKRQFVNLTKTSTTVKKETLGDMFVQYLNSQISEISS